MVHDRPSHLIPSHPLQKWRKRKDMEFKNKKIKKGNHTSWHSSIIEGIKTYI
jgi:hypothetical protein